MLRVSVRRFLSTTLALFTFAGASTAQDQGSYFEAKELRDGFSNSFFGGTVALDGDTMLVGAYADDQQGNLAGTAYIYERNLGGAESWGLQVELTRSEASEDDTFGRAVAIDADTAVVGADGDGGNHIGSAYVFLRNTGGPNAWGEVARLVASDAGAFDNFGESVSLSGDTVVVGAPNADGLVGGAVYLFERNLGGPNQWGQSIKIPNPDSDAEDQFGWAVEVSGDELVVTSSDGGFSGKVFVFRRDLGGPEAWGLVERLRPADGEGSRGFGYSAAIEAGTVAVGAPNDGAAGSVYLYERDEGGVEQWGQVAKIVPSFSQNLDDLGTSVSLDGDRLLIGGDGSGDLNLGHARVYQRTAETWTEVAKFRPREPALRFGQSVALAGDTAVIGAPGNNVTKEAAFVFLETSVDPRIEVAGNCPGEVEFTSTGLTPGALVEFWTGTETGLSTLDDGVCPGTDVGVADPTFITTAPAGPDGNDLRNRNLNANQCGLFVLIVDRVSCSVSSPVSAPSG